MSMCEEDTGSQEVKTETSMLKHFWILIHNVEVYDKQEVNSDNLK